MENSPLFWFLATLSAIFVGMGKGGLPVIATLAVPSLSLMISPIAAAGLLLPVYIVSDIFALGAYRRDFDKEVLKVGVIGMTIGVLIGGLTAHLVIDWVVIFLIGAMGGLFSIKQISMQSPKIKTPINIHYRKGYLWCTVAGFTSFISHIGGPPWQIFTLPIGLPKSVFVGTSVIAFSYCNLIKLVPYVLLGQLNLESVRIALILIFPASIAVFVGVKAVQLIPEQLFFKIINWALMGISIKLIWDGLSVPFGGA